MFVWFTLSWSGGLKLVYYKLNLYVFCHLSNNAHIGNTLLYLRCQSVIDNGHEKFPQNLNTFLFPVFVFPYHVSQEGPHFFPKALLLILPFSEKMCFAIEFCWWRYNPIASVIKCWQKNKIYYSFLLTVYFDLNKCIHFIALRLTEFPVDFFVIWHRIAWQRNWDWTWYLYFWKFLKSLVNRFILGF